VTGAGFGDLLIGAGALIGVGELLVRRLRGDQRRLVPRRHSRREATLGGEIPLELLRVDAAAVGVV